MACSIHASHHGMAIACLIEHISVCTSRGRNHDFQCHPNCMYSLRQLPLYTGSRSQLGTAALLTNALCTNMAKIYTVVSSSLCVCRHTMSCRASTQFRPRICDQEQHTAQAQLCATGQGITGVMTETVRHGCWPACLEHPQGLVSVATLEACVMSTLHATPVLYLPMLHIRPQL